MPPPSGAPPLGRPRLLPPPYSVLGLRPARGMEEASASFRSRMSRSGIEAKLEEPLTRSSGASMTVSTTEDHKVRSSAQREARPRHWDPTVVWALAGEGRAATDEPPLDH